MKASRKLWIGIVFGLVVVVLLLAGVKAGQIVTMVRAGENFSPPATAVSSAEVERIDWVDAREAIGTLVAERGVTLTAELPGKVREIAFQSGASVRKGAPLVRLDTSTEEAQLAAAAADHALAKLSLERARMLRESESTSQADLDAAAAREKQAAAQVAALESTLAKKTIRAPFDGRISIREVELGQVLVPGAPIASLQSVSPIHVDFWLPQQALAELRPGQKVRVRIDVFPANVWDGEVTTVNPEVDVSTRNVRVRATLPNPDGRLRPGMFANVEVLAEEKKPVLVVPATAILYAPYGDSVFAIEEKKDETTGRETTIARQKFVRLGDRRGDFVAVASGLEAGETVVSAGAFKLRNGMPVAVSDTAGPDAKLAPNPADR